MRTLLILFLSCFLSFQSLFAAADDGPFEGGTAYASFTLQEADEALTEIRDCYRLRNSKRNWDAAWGAVTDLEAKGYTVEQACEGEETCHLLFRDDEVRIIFTGAGAKDWGTCKKFAGTYVPSYCSGRIHRGFAGRLDAMWDSLYTTVSEHAAAQSLTPADLQYTIAGHSMGGALTSLAALRLAKLTFGGDAEAAQAHIRTITVGSPRVFDVDGSIEYDKLLRDVSLRLIHKGENWITRFPTLENGSRHVGSGVELPPPLRSMETLELPIHILPAYRSAMAQVLDTDSPQGITILAPESAWISGAWSKLKNAIGTFRWGIICYTSTTPIEQRTGAGAAASSMPEESVASDWAVVDFPVEEGDQAPGDWASANAK